MSGIRVFLFFVLCGAAFALSGQADYQAAANRFAGKPALHGAKISLSVIDMSTHREVAAINSREALEPASSLKLVSTATALIVLGKDFRFKTELQMDGYLDAEGILQGNIYLKGYGDPSLGSGRGGCMDLDSLMDWLCDRISEAGIRRIAGDVVADDSWFAGPPVPQGWTEKDGGNYYAAGLWSLNVAENMYRLQLRQNPKVGGAVSVLGMKPRVEGLKLYSRLTSGAPGSGDNAYIYGFPYDFEREVRGTIPAGSGVFTIKGSLPDAPLFAAQQLRAHLAKAGIAVDGEAKVWRKPKPERPRELIAVLHSPPLGTLVEWTNRESLNLYAEAFLRAVGKKREQEGSVAAGVKTVREVWAERGLDLACLAMADGSGLSANDAVCAYTLAVLVRKMYADELLQKTFLNSLPVAGERGSMKHFLKDSPARGRLYAKTGSKQGVRSFTGYARSRSTGKWLAFSVIVNDYESSASAVRREMLAFLERLCL